MKLLWNGLNGRKAEKTQNVEIIMLVSLVLQ